MAGRPEGGGRRGRAAQVLAIVAHDATFAPAEQRGARVWCGRCIHCNSRITVGAAGETFGVATIEHIVPQAHGGGDGPENLALACARCNHLKGSRQDARRFDDPRRQAVVAQLLARRAARWR